MDGMKADERTRCFEEHRRRMFAPGARDVPIRLAGEGVERSIVDDRCHCGWQTSLWSSHSLAGGREIVVLLPGLLGGDRVSNR